METPIAASPATPINRKFQASCRFANSVNNQNPTANPTNANAAQGKIGNNQTCGLSKMCTPFTYDSIAHGKNLGRQVVHSAGVKIATAAAAPTANTKLRVLLAADAPNPDNQYNIPSTIIEMPRMFSTSTRNRSVHGEIGIP